MALVTREAAADAALRDRRLRKNPAAAGILFALRERLVARYSEDPELWHMRILLSDHVAVGEGERRSRR